jgi:hypothetical protein
MKYLKFLGKNPLKSYSDLIIIFALTIDLGTEIKKRSEWAENRYAGGY